MRFVREDGSTYEAPWAEPVDPRRGTNATRCDDRRLWIVPTQEGFALQLNSMISALTLGARLRRVVVLMPFLATGPHYRKAVAARKMRPTSRFDDLVNVTATVRRARADVAFRHFEDDAVFMPHSARCVACAGVPPPHVRCVNGWDFAWCDRSRVRATKQPKCATNAGDPGGAFSGDCAWCVFSHGFTPGVQKAEPVLWKRLRQSVRFHDRFEHAADRLAGTLFPAVLLPLLQKNNDYVALQMRRGDKAASLDKAGLTVDVVLRKTRQHANKFFKGTPVLVATDDHSAATLEKIRRHGFAVVDDKALRSAGLDGTEPHKSPIALYLYDILLCANAKAFVGTGARRNRSKQFDLIKALRTGRHRDLANDLLIERP